MIVDSVSVEQLSHGGRRGRFVKDIVMLGHPAPLVMVRKRLAGTDGRPISTRGAVLLVHGFGQNRYSWHLSSRSLSAHLSLEGFDVFNLDLRGHGRSRDFGSAPALSLDVHIQQDLPAVIEETLRLSGHRALFYVGHSMGALLGHGLAYAQRDRLAGLLSIAAPYRFGYGSPLLTGIAQVLVRLSPAMPSRAELPMKLIRGLFEHPRRVWDQPGLPIPLRAWSPRSMEPEVLREYIQRSFDRATFGELTQSALSGTHGRFESSDALTDYAREWRRASLPLLVIAGALDLLAPPASVHPAFIESGSGDKTYRNFRFGHGDLILGREAPRVVWPTLTRWLSERAP